MCEANQHPFLQKGLRLEIISVTWMVLEAAVALSAGFAAHSLALIAFGADSFIELIAGIVLWWRLLAEMKGQSPEKVERAEKTASRTVGILLLLLAIYILASAIYNLSTGSGAQESLPGIVLAATAGVLMPVLAREKRKTGKAIGIEALEADGACSLVCAWMSWMLLLGLLMNALFKLWWIDSAVSIAFIYFVIREGLEAIRA
jgi:divalent metal cation (Fe/Co/Zn/Cd) transporter